MKKLLFLIDSDPRPSTFDTVVAYDGGADQVAGYGGCKPGNIDAIVEGAIFTRPPKEKKYTALFVGGSDLAAGQELLKAIEKKFFANFRVSVMLDSNGSNTTAAAGVVQLANTTPLKGKRAVILAGTGPVGQRAAAMFAREGAEVVLTSRKYERAVHSCQLMQERFGVTITPVHANDDESFTKALAGAQIVYATGAAGVQLINEHHWKDHPTIEALADANATPPLGIGGIDMMDKGKDRHGKVIFGGIGVGTLKLTLHRACIEKLFESNDQILDAEEIYDFARKLSNT